MALTQQEERELIQQIEMGKDFYAALGLARNATVDEVKNQYRKDALKYHPDRNSDPSVQALWKDKVEAYAVLSDPAKRARYDQLTNRPAPSPQPQLAHNKWATPKYNSPAPQQYAEINVDTPNGQAVYKTNASVSDILNLYQQLAKQNGYAAVNMSPTLRPQPGNTQTKKDEDEKALVKRDQSNQPNKLSSPYQYSQTGNTLTLTFRSPQELQTFIQTLQKMGYTVQLVQQQNQATQKPEQKSTAPVTTPGTVGKKLEEDKSGLRTPTPFGRPGEIPRLTPGKAA